jgi:hypothetical protein
MMVVYRRISASVTVGDERRYGVEDSDSADSRRSRDSKRWVTALM